MCAGLRRMPGASSASCTNWVTPVCASTCFGLLERHPGVVVLHDFYLGELLELDGRLRLRKRQLSPKRSTIHTDFPPSKRTDWMGVKHRSKPSRAMRSVENEHGRHRSVRRRFAELARTLVWEESVCSRRQLPDLPSGGQIRQSQPVRSSGDDRSALSGHYRRDLQDKSQGTGIPGAGYRSYRCSSEALGRGSGECCCGGSLPTANALGCRKY